MAIHPLHILILGEVSVWRDHVQTELTLQGHHVQTIESCEAFDDEVLSLILDVVLVPSELDKDNILEFVKRIRPIHTELIIIVIGTTASRKQLPDFYRTGSDAFLPYPPNQDEILAVLNALISRKPFLPTTHSHMTELILDQNKHLLVGPKNQVFLTNTEFTLLTALARARDRALELWQVYDVLDKTEQSLKKSALEAQIYRLRKKLTDCGAGKIALRSQRLKGYQLICSIRIK